MNMKKYKLIKEYPGSLKVGTTIQKCSNLSTFWMYKKGNNLFKSGVYNPENYPEFWDEVVEKDYEILSWEKPFGKGFNKEEFNIHSIKRLSDGEIFTVGDKINNKYIIDRFEISCCDNDILIYLDPKSSNGGWIPLKTLFHSKKVLFTTADGVDIFEGDNYYSVLKKDLLYNGKFKAEAINGGRFSNIESCVTFSTKEAAEEYILNNKAVLSLNDFNNVSKKYEKLSNIKHELKKLVKSRLC